MTITIRSTEFFSSLDGVLCRKWEGHTKAGIPITVFIHRIVVKHDNAEEAKNELIEVEAPQQIDQMPVNNIIL